MNFAATGARNENSDENAKSTPAIMKGEMFVDALSFPINGAPKIAAVPRNKISKPKAFVSLSNPRRSTRMIDVSDMYPARPTPNATLTAAYAPNPVQSDIA